MVTKTTREGAHATLRALSSLPDVPDGVADATIRDDRSETAHIDDVTRMVARESTATETIPLTEYRRMESARVDFGARHDPPNAPDSLTDETVSAVEKDVTPHACADCSGEGTNVCSRCGGRAHLPCPNDCGNGRVACSSCGGSLRVGCRSCSGDGRKRCRSCGGDGRTDCRRCDYAGRDSDGTACGACGGASTKPCSKCTGGSRPCKKCKGSGSTTCTTCSNGTVTCGTCGGSSTVSCGCGNGRVDCDTCETDGRLVTAETAVIEYAVEEETTTRSTLLSDHDLLSRDLASETVTDEDAGAEAPVVDGTWVASDVRDRHVVPIRRVDYEFEGTEYVVTDVNGELDVPDAPESQRLRDVRTTLHDQRGALRGEYDARRRHLTEAIADRRGALEGTYHRRERLRSAGRWVRCTLAVVALFGLYLLL